MKSTEDHQESTGPSSTQNSETKATAPSQLSAFTEKAQVLTPARSTNAASNDVMRKHIVRASKPVWQSDSNLADNQANGHGDRHITSRSGGSRLSSVETTSDGTSSNNLSFSLGSDDSRSSSDVSKTKLTKDASVKSGPRHPHNLLTPAGSTARIRLTDRLEAKGLQLDEIDKMLVKSKDEGKTFKEIQRHFNNLTGVKAGVGAWYERYKLLKKREETRIEKDTGSSKSSRLSKRPRTISGPSDVNDEMDVADLRKPAKRALRTSQNVQSADIPQAATTITKYGLPRQHAPISHTKASQRNIPTSMEEASEADKMLLHMKDVMHKSWAEICKTWTAMTGQQTTHRSLSSRYNRLEAALMPALTPKLPANVHQSRQDAPTSAPRLSAPRLSVPTLSGPKLSAQNNGTRPSLARSSSENPDRPPSPPSDFRDVGEASAGLVAKSAISSMPILPAHKLNHTTLRISHAGSFMPLKLRSYKTISDLFNAVASICDLHQTVHQKVVETLKVTFLWIPDNDSSRTILLKEGFEDSFEVFLETINEAPCWETDSGKCTVQVEVLHRNT